MTTRGCWVQREGNFQGFQGYCNITGEIAIKRTLKERQQRKEQRRKEQQGWKGQGWKEQQG